VAPNGAQRRKADRPPERMRGKPSSADALRPAPEGANKQTRGGEGVASVPLFRLPGLDPGDRSLNLKSNQSLKFHWRENKLRTNLANQLQQVIFFESFRT